MKQLNNLSCVKLTFAIVMALVFQFATLALAQSAYESAILADHPIGFWPLDLSVDTNVNSGGFYIASDLSGNTNAGQYLYASAAAGPTAYITNAVSFDGQLTYVDLSPGSNTALLNFGGRITMEAWVQPATTQPTSGWGDIIAKGYDGSQNNDELATRVSGGNFFVGTYGTAGSVGAAYTATTNWTYLVTTWDGTNWNIYVNGALKATSPDTVGALNFSDHWAIGDGTVSGNGRLFPGNICQVALYTNALTPNQVLSHYFAGTYGTANPVPTITTQPASRTVYVGANAYFTVSAQGTAPITYQWYQISGGVTNTLTGATNAYLVIPNAQLANSGSTYGVKVINMAGSVNSMPATLTVQTPPNGYASTVMADQPVAYYPMNETSGTTAVEYAGGGQNGTYQNSPNLGVSGPSSSISSAVTFNGSSQFVDLGDTPALNFGGQITMEAWVLPTSPQVNGPVTGWADILAKGNDQSQNQDEIKLRLTYGYQGGAYNNTNGGPTAEGPATTNWSHVVCTWDGTNWNLYANGQLEGTAPDTGGALNFADSWAIADGTVNGNNRFFSGDICQAAIYSHALTPAEVLTHYLVGQYGTSSKAPIITTQPVSTRCISNTTAAFTVAAISTVPLSYQWWKGTAPVGQNNATLTINHAQSTDMGSYTVIITNVYGAVTSSVANLTVTALPAGASLYETTVLNDNPLGYWPLDLSVDTSGSATDLSGNGNNGTYVNISSPGNEISGPSKYITNGVSFNGTNTYVDLSAGANTALMNFGGPITMEAWIQPAAAQTSSFADVLGKGSDTNLFGDDLQISLQNNNRFVGGSDFAAAGASSVAEATNWTYLVSTWDGSNWNLYVNGQLAGTNADVTGAFPFNDSWAIGNGTAYGNTGFFTGNICHVALYTRALTPAQVLTHYFIGISGTTNALPVFVQQPASQAVFPGGTVTFSYAADSAFPLTNQWYKDGAPLPAQTNVTLVLSNVQINAAADYSVVIGNGIGTTNSVAAYLSVVTSQPSVITWQTPQEISGAADVNTLGTYFGSWAPYDGGANAYPVNGVAFQGFSDLSGLNDWVNKGGGPYFNSPNTSNTNYNTLLPYGQYAPDNTSEVVDWSGMSPAHT